MATSPQVTLPINPQNGPQNGFVPRDQVATLNLPFNWTVNGLRSVEKLPDDWKRGDWCDLAVNVLKFVLGVIAAAIITLHTCGVGGLFLIREYTIQKEHETYNQAVVTTKAVCEVKQQEAVQQAKAQKDSEFRTYQRQMNATMNGLREDARIATESAEFQTTLANRTVQQATIEKDRALRASQLSLQHVTDANRARDIALKDAELATKQRKQLEETNQRSQAQVQHFRQQAEQGEKALIDVARALGMTNEGEANHVFADRILTSNISHKPGKKQTTSLSEQLSTAIIQHIQKAKD